MNKDSEKPETYTVIVPGYGPKVIVKGKPKMPELKKKEKEKPKGYKESAILHCKMCDLNFTDTADLKEHSLIHLGTEVEYNDDDDDDDEEEDDDNEDEDDDEESSSKRKKRTKSHICKICKKGFPFKSVLKKHTLMTHMGYRPFECETCGKCFSLKCSLNVHKLTHTDVKAHVCEVCNKSFRIKSHLKQHSVTHTGIKAHSCDICKKSFTTAQSLRKHSLIHKGIRPYVCNVCEADFISQSSYKRHCMRHEKSTKPFACDKCGIDFKEDLYLRAHVCSADRANTVTIEEEDDDYDDMVGIKTEQEDYSQY